METNKMIAVQVVVSADMNKAWRVFTDPDSITRWNSPRRIGIVPEP